MTHLDDKKGIKILQEAIDTIGQTMKKKKGRMVVKIEPRTTSKEDDAELAVTMERLAKENQEVAADDE